MRTIATPLKPVAPRRNRAPIARRAALAALAFAALAATACAPGFRYTHAPALEFRDLDYGFPVKATAAEPRIAYIDQGSGDRTLLLIHGLAANAGFWRANIPELAKHYRVIAVDLPGYGRSQKSTAYPYSMSFQADALSAMIRELGLRQVVPVGHSMGGQIAMTLALRHPGQVEKLVLASPAGVEAFDKGEGDWLGNALTIEGIVKGNEESIRRNLAMNFYSWDDRWEWMVEERARMARGEEMDDFADAVVKSVKGMLNEPTTGRLHQLRQPTLIVHGRYDGLIPNPYLHPGRTADVFRVAERKIPGARRVELDDAGHMLMLEKPAEFDRAIVEFVR